MWGRKQRKLAVAVMCADWRLHHKRVEFCKKLSRHLAVDGTDINAVPGPDGLVKPERKAEWDAVVGWVKLLIKVHRPSTLAVVAHQRCAGHPVADEDHEVDVVETARALQEATGFEGPVSAVVAVYHHDHHWSLKLIQRF